MITIAALPRFVFVWITLGFLIGIYSTELHQFPIIALLPIATTLYLCLWFLSGRHNTIHKLGLAVLFAVIGHAYAPKFTVESDQDKERTIIAEVQAVSRKDKEWTKTIINLLQTKHQFHREKALVYIKNGNNNYRIGDTLIWSGELTSISNKGNPHEFNAEQYWQSKQIGLMGFTTIDEVLIRRNRRWNFKEKLMDLNQYFGELLDTSLSQSAANLAKALILGDKGNLDPETIEAFGNAGAMHVLAVSGLHVGLILQMLLYLFGRFPQRISKYQALWLSVFILIFYAFLTGLSASVCRAVLMFGLLAYAKVSNKEHEPINILFGSAFLLLLWNPFYLYDIGFQLSYAAMVGIYLLFRPVDNWFFFNNKFAQKIWSGTALGIAATIFTIPLTTYYFHQFPNYFILSNLIILVLAEVILFSGIGYLTIHWVPGASWLIALVLTLSLTALINAIFAIQELPWAVAHGFSLGNEQLFWLYGLILIGTYIAFSKIRWKTTCIGLLTLTLFSSFTWNRYEQSNKHELTIYNNNQFCLTVLVGEKLHCFYVDEDKKGKLKYILSGYSKAHSASIQYCLLEPNRIFKLTNSNLEFHIKTQKNGWSFTLNGIEYLIRKWHKKSDRSTQTKIIYMPWLQKEKPNSGHWLSSDGAFQINW